jgi:hypothetical protein
MTVIQNHSDESKAAAAPLHNPRYRTAIRYVSDGLSFELAVGFRHCEEPDIITLQSKNVFSSGPVLPAWLDPRTGSSGPVEEADKMEISQMLPSELETLRTANNFKETEFKELNASLRHYSGLRYLIMPIFLAAQGGILFGLREGIITRIHHSPAAYLSIIVPIAFCLVFVALERTLNGLIDDMVGKIKQGWPNSAFATVRRTRVMVTTAVISFYVVVTVATSALIVISILALRG